jgi:5-methylcytosine-specific restriction endonuclease McrA
MPSGWKYWEQKKENYHPNFNKRALARKKRVKYTCELCGVKQGDTQINKYGKPYKVSVAAAHVNHDPWNARAKLIILCQRCHLHHDRWEHGKNARRTHYRKQREAALQSGQLELPLKRARKKAQ